MSQQNIVLSVRVASGIAASIMFILILRLSVYHPAQLILKGCVEIAGLLKKKQKDSLWYQRTLERLCRNGATFHYGRNMNPWRYLSVRILLALLGFLALGEIAVGYGILTAMLLFSLPEWLLMYLNKKDNERMLPEMKLVYHALAIQIRAGVYVTDALAECYGSVQEKRLKQALLDLAGDIVMKSDIYEALERFQGKFDNRYIDSLCITLLQACESGQAVELLNDMSEQLKDMEETLMNHKKSSLDRSITFYQLGILVAVLGVIIYACISYLFQAAINI
ncbi:MAG: type II secretion system F family protein [Lachnospiraceae bacterium]|nr:type II secretion system F family protein [Lachnospiraceae bacterium]